MNGRKPPASLFGAYAAGLSDLTQPAFRGVVFRTLLLSLLAYVVAGLLVWKGVGLIPSTGYNWADLAIDALSGIGALFLLAILFPAVIGAFIGLFLDDVAEAVEKRHYPQDSPGKALGFGAALVQALRFAALVIVVNLLALPFYIGFFFLPPLNVVLFYFLNGYLIGREYFDLVATRHLPDRDARALRRRHRGPIILAGAIGAFLFTLPLAALLAPLVVTASFVHFFKRLRNA